MDNQDKCIQEKAYKFYHINSTYVYYSNFWIICLYIIGLEDSILDSI